MADSQMRRTDSEETLMLPGRDGQPEQQQEPPSSQPYTSDNDEETFPDTDPSSQLDEDIQHYSLGSMTVAVQNSPSPMAFMLAGVVAQMMQPEKGNGKGKNEKGGKEKNEKGGKGKNENKDGKGYKGPQQRGSGSDQPGALQQAAKKTKKK